MVVFAFAAATTVGLSGCGGSSSSSSSSTGTTSAADAAKPAASQSASGSTNSATGTASTGKLGDTLDTKTGSEDPLKVTLVKVTDPATQTDPNNAPSAKMRWVGLQIKVVVNGPDGNNGSAFIKGDDGKDYGFNTSVMIGAFSGCTATNNIVPQGQPATICTGAMVPTNVHVAKVAFTGLGTETGTGVIYWTLT